MHVTLRVRRDVPSLRTGAVVHEFRRSLAEACERGSFRVNHYSLQGDHAHMIVEAHGKEALAKQRAAGPARKLTGLLLLERGVLRSHQRVFAGNAGEGEMTSGTYSPTLERSIGFARLPIAAEGMVEVDIRGRRAPARLVKPPFVRDGRARIEL